MAAQRRYHFQKETPRKASIKKDLQLVETGGIPMSPSIARKAINMLANSKSPDKAGKNSTHRLKSWVIVNMKY